jgi:hypothetical protein
VGGGVFLGGTVAGGVENVGSSGTVNVVGTRLLMFPLKERVNASFVGSGSDVMAILY